MMNEVCRYSRIVKREMLNVFKGKICPSFTAIADQLSIKKKKKNLDTGIRNKETCLDNSGYYVIRKDRNRNRG